MGLFGVKEVDPHWRARMAGRLRIRVVIVVAVIVIGAIWTGGVLGLEQLRVAQIRGHDGVAGVNSYTRMIDLRPDVTARQVRAIFDQALGLKEGWSLALGAARLPVRKQDDAYQDRHLGSLIDLLLRLESPTDSRIESISFTLLAQPNSTVLRHTAAATRTDPIRVARDLGRLITAERAANGPAIDQLVVRGSFSIMIDQVAMSRGGQTEATLAAVAALPPEVLRDLTLGEHTKIVLGVDDAAEVSPTCERAARILAAHKIDADLRVALGNAGRDEHRAC